jgi:hypothetical protein
LRCARRAKRRQARPAGEEGIAMRRLLLTTAVLLSGCQVCLAQVSTMGTTAMGLSSTPGTMLSSPLSGPSPFSAATQPGVPDTTLAPVPLASDPTTPGTAVTCSTPSGQIAPGTPTVPVTSMSSVGGTTGTTSSVLPAPTTSAIPAGSSTSTTAPIVALSAQPATSFMSTIPGSTVPAPAPAPPISTPSAPSFAATPVPTSSTVPGTISTSLVSSTATITPAAPLGTIAAPLGAIATSIVGSATGTMSPVSVLGSPSTTVCSSTPGGPPTNGAALPLSTPQIPASPAPGTIQPAITQLGTTSIDPTMIVMPTPNTSACAESVTMNLATPGMMAPANATGAAATPGVSSPSSPSGC